MQTAEAKHSLNESIGLGEEELFLIKMKSAKICCWETC